MMATGLESIYEQRPYQTTAITASRRDLLEHGSGLVVVPTGGGKTIIAGMVIRDEMAETPFAKTLVLQHTDEILRENRRKIAEVTIGLGATIGTVKGRRNQIDADIVFASTPTLMRPKRLAKLPFFTHVIIDEAHRSATKGVRRIIQRLREINPGIRILGFTATPNRSDGQTLKDVLGRLTYQITYAELIDLGYLVPVKTHTIDLGLNAALERVPLVAGEYDMDTVGQMLNRKVHNEAVYEHWLDKARGRQTVAFCSTVQHAQDLAALFRGRGVPAACVWGDMPDTDRVETLALYAAGRITVLFNCMVLTEGWDDQPTSCVMIIRPMVSEITFLQGIGRGMRAIDLRLYPDVAKTDCVVLDFAGAAVRHGSIEIRVQEERELAARAVLAAKASNDNAIDRTPSRTIRHFTMREVDLHQQAKPRYVEVFGERPCMIATHRDAWAGAFKQGATWYVLSRTGSDEVHAVACRTLNEAMAWSDRFLVGSSSERLRPLEARLPTVNQIAKLRRFLVSDPAAYANAYDAMCHLAVASGLPAIRRALIRCGLPAAA